MKTRVPYGKFQLQLKKIEELEKKSVRFKRIYSEYKVMSEELWDLETSKSSLATDDFIDFMELQKSYLEDEIEDWLSDDKND